MEKRRPHYDLKSIQAQMDCIEAMNLTMTARHGIKAIGMAWGDALVVIQKLSMENFYKSMTVHTGVFGRMSTTLKRRDLNIKFQKHEEFFIVSFKER